VLAIKPIMADNRREKMIGALIALSGFWFGFFTGSPVVCFCALIVIYFAIFGGVEYEN